MFSNIQRISKGKVKIAQNAVGYDHGVLACCNAVK
jgi:hypothetical protein